MPTGRALRPSCSRYIRARGAGPHEAILPLDREKCAQVCRARGCVISFRARVCVIVEVHAVRGARRPVHDTCRA